MNHKKENVLFDLEKIKKEKPINELVDFSILNIDKPAGWTSFDVVNFIRRSLVLCGFDMKKAGHFGTLDPQVTGVLPICLGKTCKIQDLFMHHDKVYVGKMKLHTLIEKKKLEKAIKEFVGKINQLPPRKSRVKRVVREREVKEFKLIDFDEEKKEASFYAEVQAGTYIRKLCSDLGEKLGIVIQMSELRRTRAGLFSEKDKEFITIDKFKEIIEKCKAGNKEAIREFCIPSETVCELIEVIKIKSEYLDKLKHGSPIYLEMLENSGKDKKMIEKGENFGVVVENNHSNELVEIAKFTKHFENPQIIAKPETVF